MLNIGLTSVTFRNLTPSEIIAYCKKNKINWIEWGSDVHIPAGDCLNATKIKEECEKNGISVSSYGTYYRCGAYDDAKSEFAKYIETAKILNAKTMRIWVGEKNFEDADEEYIKKIVCELKIICDMAKKENIDIGCEFHRGSLCNNKENALKVINMVNRENFGMYFQYDWKYTLEENCDTLKSFIPILKNVHVFNVNTEGRHSLGENNGENIWKEFVRILKENEINTNLLFEFLPEQTEECLKRECEILRGIIN